MKTHKPLLLLLSVTILVFALIISGCGGGNTEKPSGDATSEPATEAKADSTPVGFDPEELQKRSLGKGFTFETVMSGEGIDAAMNAKTWMQGENWRTESQAPGAGSSITIVNGAEGVMYNYLPEQKIATKIKLDLNKDESPVEDYDPSKMKFVKTDTVDGKKCHVYDILDEDGDVRVWLWDEYGFPLRLESETDGNKFSVEYKNVVVGNIPASMFQLPAGVQVMEF